MEVELWASWHKPVAFNRHVQIPDRFVEANGMPEALVLFDGTYIKIAEKDYGTPAYERLPSGTPLISDDLPQNKVWRNE